MLIVTNQSVRRKKILQKFFGSQNLSAKILCQQILVRRKFFIRKNG